MERINLKKNLYPPVMQLSWVRLFTGSSCKGTSLLTWGSGGGGAAPADKGTKGSRSFSYLHESIQMPAFQFSMFKLCRDGEDAVSH